MKKLFETKIIKKNLKEEIQAFKLLLKKESLDERKDILPFFRANINLSLMIGSLHSNASILNNYAFEFDIIGDYKADLVVGDNVTNSYCFIEFEDARKNSIFAQVGKKANLDWASRYNKGNSQIIDWLWRLDKLRYSGIIKDKFGCDEINCLGILIIGRDHFLNKADKARFEWRSNKSIVNSAKVLCLTYDDLLRIIENKFLFLEVDN
jgi:hypothetical protein